MTATVQQLGPAYKQAAILDVLRETSGPMSRRAIAQFLRRRYAPASTVAEVQAAVADTLVDLLHAGRVERFDVGNVPVWSATFADDDIEHRILKLQDRLGGRAVEVCGGDPADPLVTVTAPLSLVEGLVQP